MLLLNFESKKKEQMFMYKRRIYISAAVFLVAIIVFAIYFNFFGTQKEAYEGIFVWEGMRI
jgi:hypothetical protein